MTIYSPNKPLKVYCPSCWWGDKWDAKEFGRDFDFNKPFFPQFHELQLAVPRLALLGKNSVNSDYTNHSGDNKNCYICFGTFSGENDLYCTNMYGGGTKDCMDCYRIRGGIELLYECVDCEQSYQCQYGWQLQGCNNCYYCFDMRGCSNCFFSFNLRNKQYHIFNTPYTKEAYQAEVKKFNLGSFAERQKMYDQWRDLMRDQALHRHAVIEKSNNVSGSQIINSKNTHNTFDADDMEDTKYGTLCLGTKDSMDSYHYGITSELIYESHGLTRSSRALFTHLCYDDVGVEYCDMCQNSQHLFGCVGVKKGSYMIFNKQYSKEEYEELKKKIVDHMRQTKEYGEFFPPQLSPVCYNETQGMIYMPLSEAEVKKRGWLWQDQLPGTYGKETMKPESVPDAINDVKDSAISDVFACTACKRNFNVVQPELTLYRKESIPLPRLCPDCRYKRRIELRGPRQLWHRQCACDYKVFSNTTKHNHHSAGRCPNEFETSYAPERKEVVYCEACYNAEVV